MKNIKLFILLAILAGVVFSTMLIIKSYNPSQKLIADSANKQAEIAELKSLLGEAYIQMQEKNYNGAEKTLHLLLRKNAHNVNALILLGNIFIIQGKYKEAENTFRTVIKFAPNLALNYNNLGQALVMQGKNIDALVELKKAAELDPDAPHIHLNLPEVYIKLNRKKNAIAELKKAFDLEKKNKTISINLEAFDALKNEKEFQELIKIYFTNGGEK